MNSFACIQHPGELSAFCGTEAVSLVSAEDLADQGPDAHWLLTGNGQEVLARCSLWWRQTPEVQGQRLGFIGHYAAGDAQSAKALLNHVGRILRENGCSLAVGPVDGSTWRRYRLITRRGDEPTLFMEPDNPDTYPAQFEAAGFMPMARYYSTLNDDLEAVVQPPDHMRKNLHNAGIRIRSLDPDIFMEELTRIYDLSIAGFRNNLLYTDISRDEFIRMYTQVQPFIRQELVLLAERDSEPVGFIFALPDMARIRHGHPADTVILKSMAVLPEMSGKGIGACLMAEVTNNARLSGFTRAIHALMHEDNRSRTMSSHYGREIRQYTLYSRLLS